MKFTTLGRTGLVVSRLALGCMSYGNSRWRPWVLDPDAALPFDRRAFDLGINLLDTADMYSQGASEEVTGRAVREFGRRGTSSRVVRRASRASASRPGVTAPIVGATRIEHLDTAVKALDLELTTEECARLEAPYRLHAVRGFN